MLFRRLLPLLLLTAFTLVGLSQERAPVELSEKAGKIHQGGFLFDGHNDLPWAFRELGYPSFDKVDISKAQPQFHTDIPRLRKGGVKGVFWSVYVPASTRLRGESLQATLEQIEFVHKMVDRYPETFVFCKSITDIEQAAKDNKIASLIGVEGGHSIENSIAVLRRLYKLGARYMTLTHSDTLDWADSATDEAKHGGLTAFGEEVVAEMNRLGMLVDLSHVSDDTMRDALRVSKAPIIFSHSSARAIGDHPRNVPDDILPLVKKNGGVIMVNFFPSFVVPKAVAVRKRREVKKNELEETWKDLADDTRKQKVNAAIAKWDLQNPIPRGSIHDVVDHIEHLIEKCGVEHVGIGSDYDGISAVPRQLEDVSTFPLITQELLNRGHRSGHIYKILGGNVARVIATAEKVSRMIEAGEL